jgi:AraC-like DNA-binding protein
MSKLRHRPEPAVRGYAVTHPKATVLVAIEGGWDQLLCPASGVMTIFTPGGSWVIPPNRALWVPDGTPATVRTTGRVAVRALYLSASLRALPAETRAVNLPPLTRELVLHAVRSCPLDLDHGTDAALLTLLIDQLQTLPDAPLQLPRPRDPRAADMADAVIAEPAEDLNALAARVGASRRTLERTFITETGMALGAWRRRARTLRALELLAAGTSVTDTAAAVGYATPSSFVASFKRELGHPPRQLFAR